MHVTTCTLNISIWYGREMYNLLFWQQTTRISCLFLIFVSTFHTNRFCSKCMHLIQKTCFYDCQGMLIRFLNNSSYVTRCGLMTQWTAENVVQISSDNGLISYGTSQLPISKVQWFLSESILIRDTSATNHKFEYHIYKTSFKSLRSQWV